MSRRAGVDDIDISCMQHKYRLSIAHVAHASGRRVFLRVYTYRCTPWPGCAVNACIHFNVFDFC